MQHPNSTRVLPADTRRALTLLAMLTLSRASVAFQFQSVTSLTGSLSGTLSSSTSSFGLLLGLYMAPGAVVAMASPVLVRKLGASTTLFFALILMALGQVLLMQTPSQEIAYLSRLVAGTGGCVVYIVTIDLAARLCNAGRMPGRMGVIAASWPLGNALSLVLLGLLISIPLPNIAGYLPAALAIGAAFLTVWALRPQGRSNTPTTSGSPAAAPARGISLREWRQALQASFMPGIAFTLYNVSFIVFTSFSPELLQTQGYTLLAASNIASLPMWLFVLSVPLGGLLAGKSRNKDRWLVGFGCFGASACILLSHLFQDKTAWYVLAGMIGGLPTGAMLASADRSRHDLFYPTLFFIFFILLLAIPPIVGATIEIIGDMRSALAFCVVMLIAAFLFFIKDTSA